MNSTFSVKEAFANSTVLLTGASGYIGSIILEQILRICPDVKTVFVLFRDKKKKTAKERLEALLSSGLFHMVWETDALKKVRLVQGDVVFEHLQLKPEDYHRILEETNYVIHCAADVALNGPIQETMRSNYQGVQNVLELSKEMKQLKAFVHISTSYVNINYPSGSLIHEEIYPLLNGDREASHKVIGEELLSLSSEEAEIKSKILMDRWSFPNTYCFGKHLAEKLVQDYAALFPCAIVRPSLVGGLIGDPYPGYIDNLAGAASVPIAFAVGFYTKYSSSWNAASITDGVPGDVVASTALMATAYVSTQSTDGQPTIFQAGTSTTHPITNGEMFAEAKEFFTKEPPPYCLKSGGYPKRPYNYTPKAYRMKVDRAILATKVNVFSALLRVVGKSHAARRLRTGWKAWIYADQQRYDLNLLFSVKNTERVYSLLPPSEQKEIKCLFTPEMSSWTKYTETYLCGVKSLLMRTPLKNGTNYDFKYIAKRDPPIKFDGETLVAKEKEKVKDHPIQ